MRKPNWPTIVAKSITANLDTPFVWGEKDCCLTVADILKEFTDEDFASEFRGRYKTALGSVKALKKYGKGSLAKTLDAKFELISPEELCRGDIALVKTSAGESLGIVFSQSVWAMSMDGLTDVPMDQVTRCWRID